MIQNDFLALIVVLPLLSGLVVPLLKNAKRAWFLSFITTLGLFGMILSFLCQIHSKTNPGFVSIISHLGNWAPPWGIEYRLDALNVFVLLIISALAATVTLYARRSVEGEIPKNQIPFFYSIWLLCISGLLGITITGDAFNLYVLLEISSLSAYTLVAMGKHKNRRALKASFHYLILGTLGASFILIGIGYLYLLTGTLNMADMASRLQTLHDSRTLLVAFAFLSVGFTMKLALFPLHGWLPDAYTHAPSAVSALLASTATKVAAYAMIRFFFTIFGASFSFYTLPSGSVLFLLSCLGIFYGSYLAIHQTNVKRLLAYSSIAQIAYIALGFALNQNGFNGLTGSLIHLFNHALVKGGLFLVVGIVVMQVGGSDLSHFRGLGRKMPWTMAAFTLGGLSLVGVPLTAGFASKWIFLKAALDQGSFFLVGIILFGSLMALIYVWKVVETIYFEPLPSSSETVSRPPLSMLLPTWLLIGGSLYFGIHATRSIHWASKAAKMLLESSPL